MEPASSSNPLDLSKLTPSERKVLERARSGSTAIEVARQLSLSEATVRTHLSHIYEKLGVRGRVDLLARLQGDSKSAIEPAFQAATMQTSPVGIAAVIAGSAVAVVGLGVYQAWWTVAFAIGGFAVALFAQQQMAPARSIAIGSAIVGSMLLTGLGVFLLYGSLYARPCEDCSDSGTLWRVASIASIVTAILLLLFARRLLHSVRPHDIRQR